MKIFNKLFERSLLLRLGIAMAAITLLGVIGMASSIIIAGITQGSAETINVAGSLRMQSYRMSSLVLIAQRNDSAENWRNVENAIQRFESTLQKPKLRMISVSESQDNLSPNASYQDIMLDWQSSIKPRIQAFAPNSHSVTFAETSKRDTELVNEINDFVVKIDNLVQQLTLQAENRIVMLSTILGISLFSTLIVVFATMYVMYTDVFTPLRDLLSCAEHAGKGDLSVRSQHTGEDELGRLGEAFNAMAEDLSKMYQNLESRVAEKTADLERSNRSLELLYHSISRLYDAPIAKDSYVALLNDIEHLLGVGHGITCLIENENDQAAVLASTLEPGKGNINICTLTNCAKCLETTMLHVRHLGEHQERQILAIPLHDLEKQYGIMQLEIPNNKPLEPWQTTLLEALSRHIGIAIGTGKRSEQNRRLSLLEERGSIARELHDSLAQSLSYMKIQVSRLQTIMSKHNGAEDANQVLSELREGLNSAYRELRELLTTFRLKIEGDGLIPTLEKTTLEFTKRAGIPIQFDASLNGWHLSANEEIHIMQIVREALANITHHAKAQHAWVSITHIADNTISVNIEDDGVGISTKRADTHHYGTSIMQERARSLGGTLKIDQREGGGTHVNLSFRSGNRFIPIQPLQDNLAT
ncbi:histidine kinase [Sulfurirhabdus autotrophica]|uniref:Sensor protein n=1 Tax=Sulfurirhabdus autotrophica TaxID=1706046 RepID=A0A4R3XYB7_9PROT|nr:histidine kinase [Sulfurirhabdus autotrophica]TCV83298.1 two-component system nitrate/nitrite sensor histidine kinase NarX [Sulfurirhabdus autotrophica]